MQRAKLKEAVKSKGGMTLIEVLVATVIFATLAVALFGLFSNSAQMERRALVESLTTYTAQMMIEEVYGRTQDDLLAIYNTKTSSNPDGKLPYDIYLTEDTVKEESIALTYVWTAELFDPDSDSETSLVRVTVTVSNDYFEVSTTLEALIRPVPSD